MADRTNDMSKWRLVEKGDELGTEENQCKAEYYPERLREVWFCQLIANHESTRHALEPAWTVT